ncbi:hypothetical protein BV898_00002 [Hypsibius exemplaris]|uniref:Uncharacterized protein n=1 Tax=Hypsibius exemplaris TaxID=2072580 RepID=A0A1W0XER2_HYPEX|nr:hypothetical protein BV898_00002 [Hypsibius exemplaris]
MERKRQEAEDNKMCTVAAAWSLVQLEADQYEDDAWMLSAESWDPVEKDEHKQKPILVGASADIVTSDSSETENQQPLNDVTGGLNGQEHSDDEVEQVGGGNIKQIGFAENDASEHGEPDAERDMTEVISHYLNVERISCHRVAKWDTISDCYNITTHGLEDVPANRKLDVVVAVSQDVRDHVLSDAAGDEICWAAL